MNDGQGASAPCSFKRLETLKKYFGTILATVCLWTLILHGGTLLASSISATGGGTLYGVPLGRDSLYQTSVVGINTAPERTTFRFMIAPNDEPYHEPLRNLNWVVPVPETISTERGGQTEPLKLLTRFPDDPTLVNRRFSASAIVQHVSDGMISLGVALKIRIETEPSRELPKNLRRLAIAPSMLEMESDIDSILIFNGSNEVDTVDIYWSRSLSRRSDSQKILIFQKLLLWEVPLRSIILKSGQSQWIFLKKNLDFDSFGGFIICNGRSNSVYCRLGD